MYCSEDKKTELICPINGYKCEDVRNVKVFSRTQWTDLHRRMNFESIEAEDREQKIKAREQLKEKSKEIHKDWTNTYLGARAKKLRDRKERLEKEEKERMIVDQEWAKLQADERKKKLCEARTLQYCNTDRLVEFHSALGVGDVQRERDLQIQLKGMKQEYNNKKAQKEYQDMLKYLKDEVDKEKRRNDAIKTATAEIHAFQHSQIVEHQKQAAAEKAADVAEGEEIRRLAQDAEKLQQCIREGLLKDRKLTNKDLLKAMDTQRRLREVEKIRAEEMEEEIRIYAAAKRKMKMLQIEKEKNQANERLKVVECAGASLSKMLPQTLFTKEEHIARASFEDDARWDARMRRESAARVKALAECTAQWDALLEQQEEKQQQQTAEDKAELEIKIGLDEQAHREDEARRALRRERGRELAQLYRSGMIRSDEKRKKERQAEIEWSKDFDKQTLTQEDIFQDYAKRVIGACELLPISTYAMKKIANAAVPDGLGSNIAGDVGSNPADSDANCKPLPDIPNPQEHVEL